MTTVFIPASFDPYTLGHSEIVEHAIQRCLDDSAKRRTISEPKVIVIVGTNPDKPSGMFDKDTRKRLIEFSIDSKWRNLIEVTEATHANEKDVFARYRPHIIMRGVRDKTDLVLERNLKKHWRTVKSEIADWKFKVEWFRAPAHVKDVSSTRVRKILQGDGNPQELYKLLPKHIAFMFNSILSEHPAAGKDRTLINRLVNEKLDAADKVLGFMRGSVIVTSGPDAGPDLH